MDVTWEDIPTIEASGRLGRRPEAASPITEAYARRTTPGTRTGAIAEALGSSAGFDFAELLRKGAFPSGSQISTLHAGGPPTYTTHSDCAGFHYDGTCNEACFGFAPHHMDPYYCATCAEQSSDPNHNPSYNWHYWGSRGSIQYKDSGADPCNGKDAWKWKVGACGECEESAVFRCHDGYKKYPDKTYWDPTICQGLVACDGELTPCP